MNSRNNTPSAEDNKVVPKKNDINDSNWQASKKTVSQRNAVLFNNDLMSDVKFLVGKESNIQAILAHKFILATGSCVFYSMFYGDLVERISEIRLPDVEPSAFLNLLKYLYFDEIDLEEDNALATLYVAKKYIVPHLGKACVNYIIKNKLTAENACLLLSQPLLFDEPNFKKRCLKVIDAETELVIKSRSGGFLDVDQKILESILSRDTLTCKEIDLFEATVKWADAACKKMKIKPTPQNRRDVLGQILKNIRFPIMTLKEFANRVVNLEILTSDESVDIFRFFTADNKPKNMKFSTKERMGSRRRIFNSVDFSVELNRRDIITRQAVETTSIEISVNKKIFIIGFAIDESLTKIELTNVNAEIELRYKECLLAENNTKFSKDLSSKSWQMLFKDPVPIEKDTFYTFYAFFPVKFEVDCCNYQESVSDGNVKFNLRRSKILYYGAHGFFPELRSVFNKIIFSG